MEYYHEKGEHAGTAAFVFDVADAEGNKIVDQTFSISIIGMSKDPARVFFFVKKKKGVCVIVKAIFSKMFIVPIMNLKQLQGDTEHADSSSIWQQAIFFLLF